MWQSVSQEMYKNTEQKPPNNQNNKKESSEDVTDVDFEEVDDKKKSKK